MNVGASCENYGQFPLHKVSNIRSHSPATPNQGKWDTKEGKGKSMMHALYIPTVDGEKVPLGPK